MLAVLMVCFFVGGVWEGGEVEVLVMSGSSCCCWETKRPISILPTLIRSHVILNFTHANRLRCIRSCKPSERAHSMRCLGMVYAFEGGSTCIIIFENRSSRDIQVIRRTSSSIFRAASLAMSCTADMRRGI